MNLFGLQGAIFDVLSQPRNDEPFSEETLLSDFVNQVYKVQSVDSWERKKRDYERFFGAVNFLRDNLQGIHDNPPQQDNPESNAPFPYLTISTGSNTPFDSDGIIGNEATVEIHTWSRASHSLEAKQIMDAVYNVLHRGKIVITGWRLLGIDLTTAENPRIDPDGITRHGVQRFRVLYREEEPNNG